MKEDGPENNNKATVREVITAFESLEQKTQGDIKTAANKEGISRFFQSDMATFFASFTSKELAEAEDAFYNIRGTSDPAERGKLIGELIDYLKG